MFLLHDQFMNKMKMNISLNEDEYIAIFQAKIIITLRRGTYTGDSKLRKLAISSSIFLKINVNISLNI